MVVYQNHPPYRCQHPIPADPPPPPQKKKKKNRLPPQGGSGIPPIPKKNRFFHFFAYFRLFSMSSSKAIFGQMKTNFKKPREVFLHNGMKNKNLSQFFHRCHEQGESKPSFEALFSRFSFFCYSPDFAGAVTASWRTNLAKPKEVFVQNMPIYNNLLHFFPRCHR
jgi:hypothetical protein